MTYSISKLEIISVDGVQTKQVLTLEATFDNQTTSLHGKEVALDADIPQEAIDFAAELETTLEQPVITISEPVDLTDQQKEIDQQAVLGRVNTLHGNT